jgi:hypothetical protein
MRKPKCSILIAALVSASMACAVSSPAAARDQAVIAMSGVIHPGAAAIFRTVVSRERPDLVVVSGPGGDLGTALQIAAEVRRRGFDTAIPRGEYCASACAVIFLSGRTKYAASGSRLGLHAASNLDGSYSREGTAIMSRYLARIGVPAGVLTRMEKRQGNDMYWLGDADRRALRIVALGSSPPPSSTARPRASSGREAARVADRPSAATGCSANGQGCYRTLSNGVIMKVR